MVVKCFLGIHTCVPKFIKAPGLHSKTILRKTGGMLPPYIICCGDRRRVKKIASYLDKHSATHLDHLMDSNGEDPGRVSVVVGTYKGTPVTIFEHQMGCAACEILSREVLHPDVSTRAFTLPDGIKFQADSKYIIRVGSCGGINGFETKEEEKVALSDVIVTNSIVGIDGTTTQSLTGNMNAAGLSKDDQETVMMSLKELGYSVNEDMPVFSIDQSLAKHLQAGVQEHMEYSGTNVLIHAACSKDSLYAETREEDFMHLRDKYDVACTEMELSTINYIAQEYSRDGESVKAGMCCVVLGVLPGESFGGLDREKYLKASKAAACGALECLHKISLNHKIQPSRI